VEQKTDRTCQKDTTQLKQCYVPVIFIDPSQHIQTLTKQRVFWFDNAAWMQLYKKLYHEVIKLICNDLHFQSALLFSVDLLT